jgi:hypothetical protein
MVILAAPDGWCVHDILLFLGQWTQNEGLLTAKVRDFEQLMRLIDSGLGQITERRVIATVPTETNLQLLLSTIESQVKALKGKDLGALRLDRVIVHYKLEKSEQLQSKQFLVCLE